MKKNDQSSHPGTSKVQKSSHDKGNSKDFAKESFPDPEVAHKKFIAGMVGISLIIFLLMLLMGEGCDFDIGG